MNIASRPRSTSARTRGHIMSGKTVACVFGDHVFFPKEDLRVRPATFNKCVEDRVMHALNTLLMSMYPALWCV